MERKGKVVEWAWCRGSKLEEGGLVDQLNGQLFNSLFDGQLGDPFNNQFDG